MGLSDASTAKKTQVAQDGTPYQCLLQNDVNLTSPDPLPTTCTDSHTTASGGVINSAFANKPFSIDDYIKPTDTTCPAPGVFAAHGVKKGSGLPGGCTEDIVHRFYQEQFQIDGGKQDRYTTGSDAIGLTQGTLPDQAAADLPLPAREGRPEATRSPTTSSRRAFGGSFLNHQWLIAARAPLDTNPASTYTAGRCAREELHPRRQRLPERVVPALQAGHDRAGRPAHAEVRRPDREQAPPGLR